MSNVIPFPARTLRLEPCVETPLPLYRLAVTRAKALGVCPDPANDTTKRASRRARRETSADPGAADDALASLLERSIRAAVESARRAMPAPT